MTVSADRLVYVFKCDRRLRYPEGKSRIAYIGTTGTGVWRITSSAAQRATEILNERGVDSFDAHVVTCTPRRHVKTWHKLERAMLLMFRELFGDAPLCNSHGSNMEETDEFDYFSRARIRDVIEELS